MTWCEDNRVDYVFGFARNQRLRTSSMKLCSSRNCVCSMKTCRRTIPYAFSAGATAGFHCRRLANSTGAAESPPAEIGVLDRWPNTSLLDVLKEADLRIGFTDVLRSATSFASLDRALLRERSADCLAFQLLPRLKPIYCTSSILLKRAAKHSIRIWRPFCPNAIDWDLIEAEYDPIIKYATGLRLGTANAEDRRFGNTPPHVRSPKHCKESVQRNPDHAHTLQVQSHGCKLKNRV
jgi:hypothetical protein